MVGAPLLWLGLFLDAHPPPAERRAERRLHARAQQLPPARIAGSRRRSGGAIPGRGFHDPHSRPGRAGACGAAVPGAIGTAAHPGKPAQCLCADSNPAEHRLVLGGVGRRAQLPRLYALPVRERVGRESDGATGAVPVRSQQYPDRCRCRLQSSTQSADQFRRAGQVIRPRRRTGETTWPGMSGAATTTCLPP